MPGSLRLPAASAASRAARESPAAQGGRRPALSQLILRAAARAPGRGVSFPAIKKMLASEGYDVRKNKSRIKSVLRYLLRKAALLRVSGSGASGSFRLQRGSGALKPKQKPAAAKRRKNSVKTGTDAPGPSAPSGKTHPAAGKAKSVGRSRGKIRGTVATRRKEILEDIIQGTFLME